MTDLDTLLARWVVRDTLYGTRKAPPSFESLAAARIYRQREAATLVNVADAIEARAAIDASRWVGR